MNNEDLCPVSEALDFFSRKWVFCILMDMFNGCKHFTDFQQSNPDLSNYVLSQTLKYMENIGLIEKEHVDLKTRNKTVYTLSKKGLKVNRILYELTLFSLEELESSKLDDDLKNKILEKYSNALGIL
ncbi:MAG: helix-turn-helix transcriptional regulator [Methanobrevibacter sp.]|nr:helix-turn-helix transcriptional regulator [Methanobrevibacter sp.]